MNEIKKIVLTGGPCAGKTTAKDVLTKELESIGYKVFFVTETATEILNMGANPNTLGGGSKGLYLFQKAIFELQERKEEAIENMVANFPADKKVIIYDRGLTDGKGFGGKKIYDQILYEENRNEFAIRDRYDAVFHLVTAAKGAEAFYGNATNEVRMENVAEARQVDDNIISAWTGHPHLRVIGNNGRTFDQKIGDLVKGVKHFLGEPVAKEIEKKFLIKYPNLLQLQLMTNCQVSHITQVYLKSKDGYDRRIRQREQEGYITYTYTEKKSIGGSLFTREENEKQITAKEYNLLMKEADWEKNVITKDRYNIVEGETTYEIDVYPFWDDRAILEIEMEDEKEDIVIPDFVEVVRDVTEESAYKNSSLAKSHSIDEPDLEESVER